MPRDFNFLCNADLSIPIKSAVLEILPWCFFNCVDKYSFSKCSLASFKGDSKDFSNKSFSSEIFDEGKIMSSIILLTFFSASGYEIQKN